MTASLYAGIDLGGTKIHAVVGDESGVLAEHRAPTSSGGDGVADRVADVVDALLARAGLATRELSAVGIGGAGVPDGDDFALAPNLPAQDGSFSARLGSRLGARIVLDNDVNIAAVGELHHGVGIERDDFAVVAVGTGVGAGLVVGRRVLRGTRGAAGEIGFLPLGSDPLDPAMHRRGPLEERLAGDALQRRYREATGLTLAPAEIFDRVEADTAAFDAVDEHARWLAMGLAALDALIDPGLVVLAGGIGSRPELAPLVRGWLDRLDRAHLDLRPSPLGGRAAVLGALHIAREAAHRAVVQEGLVS